MNMRSLRRSIIDANSMQTHRVPKLTLCHPRGSQKVAFVTEGVPKGRLGYSRESQREVQNEEADTMELVGVEC